MKICSKCGVRNEDIANYCFKCGAILDTYSEKTEVKRKPTGFWIKVFAVSFLGVLIGAAVVIPRLKKFNPLTNPGDIYDLTGKDEIIKAINETNMFLMERKYTKDKEVSALQSAQKRYYEIRMAYLIGSLWTRHKKSKEMPAYMVKRWEYSKSLWGLEIENEVKEFTELYPGEEEVMQKGWYHKCSNDIQKSYREPSKAYEAIMFYIEKYPYDEEASKLIGRAYHSLSKDAELQNKIMKLANEKFPDAKEITRIKDSMQKDKAKREAVGKKFNLEFKDIISRKNISFSLNKDKIIIIDFWATWCGPCVAEIPKIKKLYNKYKNKNVLFIGINLDKNKDKVIDFCKENQIEWPQYYDGEGWNSDVVKKWGISGIPTLFALNKGNIIYSVEARGNLEKIIEELIKK
ncbi:MAG: thioredoxin-like domain-containing protein [bacterium]